MNRSTRGWALAAAVVAMTAGGLAPLATTATAESPSSRSAAPSAPSLFTAPSATTAKLAADTSRGAVERARYVGFDADLLAKSADGQKLALPFFDDASFTATVSRVQHQKLFTSWSGPLDTALGTFVATRTGDTVTVLANTPGGNYMMMKTAGGTYQVTETSPVNDQAEDVITSDAAMAAALAASPASDKVSASPATTAATGQAFLAPTADRRKKKGGGGKGDDGSITDILIGYTADAYAAYGGDAGILNEAAFNISITNAAYANSGAKTTVRLVGVVPVSGKEVGSRNLVPDLSAFTRRGDGKFDEIHKYIKKTHADDSILLEKPYTEGGSFCGLAWEQHNQPASRAFAVMATGRCTDGQPTFPHELGHNQGALHDLYTQRGAGLGGGGGKAQYPYGYGYVAPDCAFITIMSYQDECIQKQGIYVQPILYFSNPVVAYGGQTTGTKKHNNVAKLITKTRKRVAAHQQSTLYLRSRLAIKPAPKANRRVHVVFSGWVNGPVKTKFQWYLDGVKIKGAKGRFYKVRKKDAGHALAVVVTGKKRTYGKVAIGSKARIVKGK